MPLKTAMATYGLTQPIKSGEVATGLDLSFVEVEAITADGMRPMVRNLAFDICEMAFTTYLCARAAGKPIIAIPVFVTRNFHHWAVFRTKKSGIKTPKDLEGRRVAVNRGYTVTTGLWVRGILRHEYGVDLEKITWMPTDEEHVLEFKAPANVDHRYLGRSCADLLASGEVNAAIGDIRTSPEIEPLIANAQQAGFAYYHKTGIYPINHTITMQNATLAANPDLPVKLCDAFAKAKAIYRTRLVERQNLKPADEQAIALSEVVGDPFPFGVEANRKAIETLVSFAVEQHMLPAPLAPETLFAPATLALSTF